MMELKEDQCVKHKSNFDFINQVIKDYRPSLYPKGGLKPVPEGTVVYDVYDDKDNDMFLTDIKNSLSGGDSQINNSEWFD
jgi:hypothetical protein